MNIIDQCLNTIRQQFEIIGCVTVAQPTDLDLTQLEVQLRNMRREVFENNERILIVLTGDCYSTESAGLGLQSIQTLLNTIDISNFFVELVTTNPDIETEYQWILKNISLDPVPLHITQCQGEYHRWDGSNFQKSTKYTQWADQLEIFKNLNPQHQQLLENNKAFCILPWTHLMIDPNGDVRPCCVNPQILGNVHETSLEELWNSNGIKQLRKNMLEGKKSAGCNNCYHKEKIKKESTRMLHNKQLAHRIYKVNSTQPDGHLDEFSLNYLDSRFNNLCNLACRSCGPEYSSSWHDVAVKLGDVDKSTRAIKIAGKNSEDVYKQIMQQVDNLDMIYFAGGEPLIIEQFYKMLDYLEETKQFDKRLIYNTNFTQTTYKKRSIFDTWKKFQHVSVGASLDAEGARAEYLRSGTRWDQVIQNRKTMLEVCPDVDFYIAATTGLINALHVPDFHRSWTEQGLITAENFTVQVLYGPKYQSIIYAPKFLKQQIKEKYIDHLNWLRPLDRLGRATNGFESMIEMIDQSQNLFDPNTFWYHIDRLDQCHNTNLIEIFPELRQIPRG